MNIPSFIRAAGIGQTISHYRVAEKLWGRAGPALRPQPFED